MRGKFWVENLFQQFERSWCRSRPEKKRLKVVDVEDAEEAHR